MSLEIVRAVAKAHPELLRENLGSTCWEHTVYVIAALKAAGHQASHICKSAGEGQYTPPGFEPRTVTGLDGKPYVITGVSHDAIWVDGIQVDTLAKANDSQEPIFEADGSPMIAVPVWNEIPRQSWRPNNPPLPPIGHEPVPVPKPPTPPAVSYPDDAYFIEHVGVPLEADYALAGQTLNAGASTWFARTIFDAVSGALTMDASVAKHRAEWRSSLGLPPL
jgi:hypothetical protein